METLLLIGFFMSAYAVVANDSIQTLGTFISSNKQRQWWHLWLWFGGIMVVTATVGWYLNGGDLSWGRLSHIPYPVEFKYKFLIAPVCLLVLTRLGVPVSTTLFTLTTFASAPTIMKMVKKSVTGYVIASVGAYLLWTIVARHVKKNKGLWNNVPPIWSKLQVVSTSFLWITWLMHDSANHSVFLPRNISINFLLLYLGTTFSLLGLIFYLQGGKIQQVVQRKSDVINLKQVTIIDLFYGTLLYIFKVINPIPMSTTWLFVGMLAGREIAMTQTLKKKQRESFVGVGWDFLRLVIGLVISVGVAVYLP
tara:strand:- start:159 stop:1082 length:924 start_codon:yes stop_codon:yes gene_type:complete